MKIAILGGGYTGLSAAYHLSQKGQEVTVFEKDNCLGGLTASFKNKYWKWPLEKNYHHIFTTDRETIELAQKLGCKLLYIKPKTSIFTNGRILPFSSVLDLLTFPEISIIARIRTGLTMVYLKLLNNWLPLEKIAAAKFVQKISGSESWEVIWQPLFEGKFDKAANKVPASWFWSRIKKRSLVLVYLQKGHSSLIKAIVSRARNKGAKFLLNTKVESIKAKGARYAIMTNKGIFTGYEKIICTLPAGSFVKVAPKLPLSYLRKIKKLEGRGAINLILSLKNQFLTDGTYWLNINDRTFPFIGIIEQTNFIPKENYGGDNIINIANYLPNYHRYFETDKKSLINEFLPFLKKINPNFNQDWIKKSWLTKSEFAQPVYTLNYSQKIPPFKTPIKNIYLANMQQVYPWDRQTNYAIELGRKVSEEILT